MQDKLEILQKICNELYENEGLTNEVLDLQVVINKLKNKHDISDENQKVYENYMQ